MKMKNLVKAAVVAVVALVVVLGSPVTTFANGGDSTKTTVSEEKVNVMYLGTKENNVVFRVTYDNPSAEKFTLLIKNDAGDVVFRKQFADAHFAKVVYFSQDGQDTHPTFVIRDSNNNEIVRKFAINTQIIESIVVTKL